MRHNLTWASERYGAPESGMDYQMIIAEELRRRRIRLVVIDDDPTGIQTVHGCLLLTQFTPEWVEAALDDAVPFFYMLVNSRALTEAQARQVVREAVEAVLAANRQRGYNLLFVSRSDSTLRGHFPAESDTISEVLTEQGLQCVMPTLFVPAFFEAGRMTIEGIHYMASGEELIPVNETEFARDNVFGYQNAELVAYILEKGKGAISRERVSHASLRSLRMLQPDQLAQQLAAAGRDQIVAFDALDYRDLRKLSLAILAQFDPNGTSQCGVIRSSSSLPKALSGIEERGYVAAENEGARGVVIVGSHVKKSTEQLMYLLEGEGVQGIEIDVEAILNDDPLLQERLLQEAAVCHAQGITPVLYTSRREVRCDDAAKRQALGGKISQCLVQLVKELPFRPDFLVSKGGITSHDILTHSLGIRCARVEGQAAAGIPTIRTSAEDRFPNLRYIIFPGNVGSVTSLREVVDRLRG